MGHVKITFDLSVDMQTADGWKSGEEIARLVRDTLYYSYRSALDDVSVSVNDVEEVGATCPRCGEHFYDESELDYIPNYDDGAQKFCEDCTYNYENILEQERDDAVTRANDRFRSEGNWP